jgi:hypothetical protein
MLAAWPRGEASSTQSGMTGLSAARMAAARSSGSSALISVRGRARQVAPSGPRGTYQISQSGNCRSSSRRRSPCPTPSARHSKHDGHLPAVVYLRPAYHPAVASGQGARTTCPRASPCYRAMYACGRAGQMPVSILAGPVPDRATTRRLGYHPARAALSILRTSTRPALWEKGSGKYLPALISRIGTGIDARCGSRRPATGLHSKQSRDSRIPGNAVRSPTGACAGRPWTTRGHGRTDSRAEHHVMHGHLSRRSALVTAPDGPACQVSPTSVT